VGGEHLAGVPRIEAYPGELNQVWTNLIDNAVDAMDGTGTLRVATRVEGDSVVVEIVDTGPGMPRPPVVARRGPRSGDDLAQRRRGSPTRPGNAPCQAPGPFDASNQFQGL
jgi:hypothetical protein